MSSAVVRFTLDEYDRMIEHDVFDETRGRRMELIHGELREMIPPNPPHEDVIDLLDAWSHENAPRSLVRIRVQNSIGIQPLDSAPQPDLAWVTKKSYRAARPQPADALLVIEVSDSTVEYDSGEKAGLYARAGIADYGVVNIPRQCIEIFRDPHQGTYHTRQTVPVGESVRPLAFPDLELPVSILFAE